MFGRGEMGETLSEGSVRENGRSGACSTMVGEVRKKDMGAHSLEMRLHIQLRLSCALPFSDLLCPAAAVKPLSTSYSQAECKRVYRRSGVCIELLLK